MKKNDIIFRKIGPGFTLTELLVVVIIIGILATLALPMLVKTLEKAKVGEAVSNLNLVRTGQKIYFLEHGCFAGDPGGIAALNIEDPNTAASRYFNYSIPSAIGATTDFTAQANRLDGPRKDDKYYIHLDGTISGSLM